MVQPYVPELNKQSMARIATNQEFVYIQQDIEELKKLQADKSITLNEREAIKERQTNEARQKLRDDERNARKPVGITLYNLTLADADKPGLPGPVYFPGLLETNFSASTSTN